MTTPDDIEIYIKKVAPEKIVSWLEHHFEQVDVAVNKKGIYTGTVTRRTDSEVAQIPLYVLPKAAGASFTSLWFKSSKTPWKTDLECAEAFLEAFDTEVRISHGTWTENSEPTDASWQRILRDKKQLVSW